jgi:hypothetical protein
MWKHINVLPRLGNIVCWRLAPRTMLLGHGRTFLCLLHRCQSLTTSPYNATWAPLCQMDQKGKIMRVVKNHPCVSYLLNPPSNTSIFGTNKEHPNTAPAARITHKNAKGPPTSPECASALPVDVGDDRVHICTRFRWRKSPGSLMRLPGKFQGTGGTGRAQNASTARVF